jgi:hypothetical protein
VAAPVAPAVVVAAAAVAAAVLGHCPATVAAVALAVGCCTAAVRWKPGALAARMCCCCHRCYPAALHMPVSVWLVALQPFDTVR